jgi:amidase
MLKKIASSVLLAVLLAACVQAPLPAPPTAAPSVSSTEAPTEAPTAAPAATEAPVATEMPAAEATAAPSAEANNTPRLRALDFAPFNDALTAFTAERATAIEAIVKDATIPQVQEAMQAGNLTAEELTLYFLSRIKQYDETLRHYLELNPAALDEARASDARRKDGKLLGAMDGIPVSLKDNIETTAPLHTTGGAEILLNNVPAADAPLVKGLRDAGAVILGKANLSELAGSVSPIPGASAVGGLTVNPHGDAFTAGGSSSGSAAGVAGYQAFASVGSETAGSLIAPSSWNGVVGMYPSRGLVDGAGVIPLLKTNDTAGPVGRSVTDVALLLSAIDTTDTDYAAGLKPDALKDVKAGFLKADVLAHPTSMLEDTTDNAGIANRIEAGLASAGAVVTDTKLGGVAEGGVMNSILNILVNGGVRHDMLPYLVAAGAPITDLASLIAYNAANPSVRIPFTQQLLEMYLKDTTVADKAEFEDAVSQGKPAAAASLDAAFAEGLDVLVSVNNYHSQLYATANYPAVTVPLGLRVNGAPVGVTFIGKLGEDAKVLAYAYAFEQATKARVNPDVAATVNYINLPARTFTYGDAWQPVACEELGVTPDVAAQADCGYVTVPEKRGESGLALGDKTIQLGVVRVRSTSKTPGTPVVKGEGGPGGPGLFMVATPSVPFMKLYAPMLANHDLVFFTQRGTRGAKPELNCEAFDAVQYEAALKGWTQEEKEAQYSATVQQCADAAVSQGIDLSAYNSDENADDVNAIRETLGYDKINYYGLSYGTLLGQYVMRRHPDILESVILDGNVPAEITQYSQVVDIQKSFKRVFAACAADAACNAAYPDLENVFNSVIADLKANPAPIEITQSDGTTATLKVDHLAAMGGLFIGIYGGGRKVPAEIYALKDRDYATLVKLAPSPGGSTAKLMHFTVNCADDPNTSMDQFKLDTIPEPYRDFVNDDGATEVLACQVLKVPQLSDVSDELVKSDLPVLLLNGGLDPATDAEYGRVIAAGLPNSQYVLFPANGHGQAQESCAVSIITAFLKDPALKVDTNCIVQKPAFALPILGSVASPDGAASLTMKLPGNYVPSGSPATWGLGKTIVSLKAYAAGTTVEDALSAALAPAGIKLDPAQISDGPEIAGQPSKLLRAVLSAGGDDYDLDYYAIALPSATFVIQFGQGDASLKQAWRDQSVPSFLKTATITQ